jgi:hypothetical protein
MTAQHTVVFGNFRLPSWASAPVAFNLGFAYLQRYAKTSYGVCTIDKKLVIKTE